MNDHRLMRTSFRCTKFIPTLVIPMFTFRQKDWLMKYVERDILSSNSGLELIELYALTSGKAPIPHRTAFQVVIMC